MYFYLLALVRQMMWLVPNDIAAWICTVLLASIGWMIFLKYYDGFKGERKIKLGFVVMVIVPVTILFLIRLPFPDTSYDVLNYHLLEAQRSLAGTIMPRSDVDYNLLPNSLPDMILGIFRFFLGYRLGTIGNLLAIIWLAVELRNLLSKMFKNDQMISLSVLAILLCENIFYEINTYMIDLLALPLLVHLLNVLLEKEPKVSRSYKVVYMSFFGGLVIALKLTNIIFVVPILIVELFTQYRQGKLEILQVILMLPSLLIGLFPFHLFMWVKTGNPIFPFYNGLFHSPFWSSTNFKDLRWGPISNSEKVLWPIMANFLPNRISELAHYSGRLLLGILAIPLAVLTKKKHDSILPLSAIFIVSAVLWSISTGYIRYAIFLDILGGLLFIVTIDALYRLYFRSLLGIIMVFILIVGLQVQILSALDFSLSYNWSSNPTVFGNKVRFLEESRDILHDYDLTSFQSASNRHVLRTVGAWLDTSPLTSGIEIELKSDVPFAFLRGFRPPNGEMERFLMKNANKNIYTICMSSDFTGVQRTLEAYNLGVVSVRRFIVPYYSTYTKLNDLLIRVSSNKSVDRQYSYGAALPKAADRVSITAITPVPREVTHGQALELSFKVKNASNIAWPMAGDKRVDIGDHWLTGTGKVVIHDDGRGQLLKDLEPGKDQVIDLDIKTPEVPGKYILQVDMVQEGVRWFSDKGPAPFQTTIVVH